MVGILNGAFMFILNLLVHCYGFRVSGPPVSHFFLTTTNSLEYTTFEDLQQYHFVLRFRHRLPTTQMDHRNLSMIRPAIINKPLFATLPFAICFTHELQCRGDRYSRTKISQPNFRYHRLWCSGGRPVQEHGRLCSGRRGLHSGGGWTRQRAGWGMVDRSDRIGKQPGSAS